MGDFQPLWPLLKSCEFVIPSSSIFFSSVWVWDTIEISSIVKILIIGFDLWIANNWHSSERKTSSSQWRMAKIIERKSQKGSLPQKQTKEGGKSWENTRKFHSFNESKKNCVGWRLWIRKPIFCLCVLPIFKKKGEKMLVVV